jgi:hypothetical protein
MKGGVVIGYATGTADMISDTEINVWNLLMK